MKKFLILVLSCFMILTVCSTLNVSAETHSNSIRPMSWPGNPNGDVEWQGYNCKVNWKYMNTTSGKVSDLQKIRDDKFRDSNDVLGALGILLSPITFGGSLTVSLASWIIGRIGPGKLKGETYTSTNYQSDDCYRNVINYKDKNGKVISTSVNLFRKKP